MSEHQTSERFNALAAAVVAKELDLSESRQAYKAKYDNDTVLADDAIIGVIAKLAPNEDSDFPDDDTLTAEMRAEEIRIEASARSMEAECASVAKEMAGISELMTEVSETIQAHEKVKRGPLWFLKHVQEKRPDLLPRLPLPGTKEADVKGSNRPYDVFSIIVEAEGEKKTKKTSFYEQLAISFDDVTKLDCRPASLGGPAMKQRQEAKDKKAMSSYDYNAEKKRLGGLWNTLKRQVRDMGAVYHQIEAFNSCNMLSAGPRTAQKLETDGETIRDEWVSSVEPIRVTDEANPKDRKSYYYAISTFLKINMSGRKGAHGTWEPGLIQKHGADKLTYTHIVGEQARETGTNKGAEALKVDKVEKLFTLFDGETAYLDGDGFATATAVVSKDDEAGNAALLSAYYLSQKLDALLGPHNKRLQRLLDAEEAKEKAEQKAKARAV